MTFYPNFGRYSRSRAPNQRCLRLLVITMSSGRNPWSRPHEVLKQWWNVPKVNTEFFANADSPYRLAVNDLLLEFNSWRHRLAGSAIPALAHVREGLLPGDQSV